MKFYRTTLFFLLLCFVFPLISNADQLEDANAAIKNENYKKACELLLPLAKENNTEAQTLLGAMYINGQGVEEDFNKGMALIMKAAKQGFTPARIKAFKLNFDLAEQGNTGAMYNVGYMCLNGWGGGEYDTNVCLKSIKNAGLMGHEKSAKLLARIYKEGMFGVPPDEKDATFWGNYAAGINGRWKGSVTSLANGLPISVVFEIKKDGDKLTGTHSTNNGVYNKIPINDGKIDGNKFSFFVTKTFSGLKITDTFTGIFLGDKLQLTVITEDGRGRKSPPYEFTVRRRE